MNLTINEKVRALTNQYQTDDLYSIAYGEGITINPDPIDLPKGIVLGMAAVCNGYRSIYLQESLNEVEKQQAIARALGMHLLYLSDMKPTVIAVMQNATDEQQENIISFADSLLQQMRNIA
ncbi:hypothetical protein [Paenibacillus xylanilyticus]|uniref:Uncharacterized protein n=1 Tax=Paenibacillus xylanilyticus TaxID=248903 RepID=A0A7Y6BTM9_9BACL|nr:hypothetical protein [Paenibacillus xylanilyticus]NUU74639.1 hypothetical protein [Paenibacillus xylanilyticus]